MSYRLFSGTSMNQPHTLPEDRTVGRLRGQMMTTNLGALLYVIVDVLTGKAYLTGYFEDSKK